MSQAHIRIAKTPEVERVLSNLRTRYSLLSESEIVRLALSDAHNKETEATLQKEQKLKENFHYAMKKGKEVGIRLMKEKGLDPHKVTEQEFYDTFLSTHKH